MTIKQKHQNAQVSSFSLQKEELVANPPYHTQPFGIYIHWPFCKSKCPYCDFYKEINRNINQEVLIKQYIEDLDFYYQFTSEQQISSIFFGGGTPSLLKPSLINQLINHIHKKWKVKSDVEISLEANPNSDRANLFNELHLAGINRLSLGVQALNSDDLKFLGRTHNLTQALQAIDEVLKIFNNHSIDLIYARPDQQISSWQTELKQACSFGFKHISLYQLTIEEGTFFAKKHIKTLDEDSAAEMYLYTNEYLNNNGYPQYEVSNYGLPCHHNLIYWQGDNYLGIGKSAHGRFTYQNKFFATTDNRHIEPLSREERAEELVLMGLRLTSGINKQHFREICGISLDSFINQENLKNLIKYGYLQETAQNLYATPQGFLILNRLIENLCA